ncbi:hypothetical protein HF521_007130 [Silurus meridionalis]|uniref:Uncharacterized protein n=1 Tax=Silurus meridionalis TaxID=175797 RepID=A0A8T0AQJ2_SILME|nr:hypothetical protein HF521_007130 [Silurus meridionalis]
MRRNFTSEEVLEEDMQPDSSVLQESFSDSADSRDSDPDFVAASSSSTSTTESEGDSKDSGSGWIGKNGQVWFPNNEETLRFVKHARGGTGSSRHSSSRYGIFMVDGGDLVYGWLDYRLTCSLMAEL